MRYRFLDFEVDTDRELLIGPAGPVVLRRQAWRMLIHLIGRAPAVVTRDELMDALWGHHALSPNVIPQTISELRQALGDDAQESRCIETRHRRGYAFIAAVSVLESTAERSTEPAPAESTPAVSSVAGDTPEPQAPAHESPVGRLIDADAGRDEQRGVSPTTPDVGARVDSASGRRALPWVIAALAVAVSWVIALGWRGPTDPSTGTPTAAAVPVALPTRRPILSLTVADPALSAYLRLLGQSGADWVVLSAKSPVPAAAERLIVDRERQWRLLRPDGSLQREGQLPVAAVPMQAAALLQALELAGAAAPTGWPSDAEAKQALAEAGLYAERGQLSWALRELRDAEAAETGWAGYFHAELLARAGYSPAALERLAALDPAGDRPLRLLIEALRAELEGRPADQLAALGAYALLLPEALDRRLQLLDLQLTQAQWSAAAASLDGLSELLGEDAAALAWRRAQWLAAVQPAEAAAAFDWALERASAEGDAARLREARLAAARWHLRHTRHAEAAALLASLGPADPIVRELSAQLARERGALAEAESTLSALAEDYRARGALRDLRRIEAARIEVQLQGGDTAGADTAVLALLASLDTAADPELRPAVLVLAARALSALGDFDTAVARLQEAIALAGARGQGLQEAQARYQLGNVLALQRLRKAEAGQAWQLAAEAFARAGDRRGEAQTLANLALLAQQQGRLRDARIGYRDALERLAVLDLPREQGRVTFNLAVTERELGELRSAAAHLDAALPLLATAGAAELQVAAAATRADLALSMGEPALAADALAAVAELRRQVPPLAQSGWLTASARLALLAGDRERAAQRLLDAQTLREQANVEVALLDLRLQQLRLGLTSAASAGQALLALEDIEARLTRLDEARYALAAGLAVVEAQLVAGNAAAARRKLELLQPQIQQHGNRAQSLQHDWLRALLEAPDLRDARLRAVAESASAAGFTLLARLAQHAQQAEGSPPRAELEAALSADQLSGALASPAFAF